MTHTMDEQQKLRAELEAAKVVLAMTRKDIEKENGVLQKMKLENEVFQMEVRSLKLDNASLGSAKAKVEQEGPQLRLELEQVQADFIKEKKDLKVTYHKKVDDMFYYEYSYYMRKHEITDDIPNIPYDDEAELGEDVQVAYEQSAKGKSVESQSSNVVEQIMYDYAHVGQIFSSFSDNSGYLGRFLCFVRQSWSIRPSNSFWLIL